MGLQVSYISLGLGSRLGIGLCLLQVSSLDQELNQGMLFLLRMAGTQDGKTLNHTGTFNASACIISAQISLGVIIPLKWETMATGQRL